MAETKKVITGSTGNAYVDMPARTAWVLFIGHIAVLVAAAIGANTWLTGEIVALAGTGAVLGATVFDAHIKPRL